MGKNPTLKGIKLKDLPGYDRTVQGVLRDKLNEFQVGYCSKADLISCCYEWMYEHALFDSLGNEFQYIDDGRRPLSRKDKLRIIEIMRQEMKFALKGYNTGDTFARIANFIKVVPK